nr:PQQ-binding-like beta-propeller repeat protein [uncultured Actinoplanes sp.]
MATIDLGEVTTTEPQLPPVPLNHRRIARTLLAALAVLGLLVAGGSARPAAPFLHTAWSTEMLESDHAGFTDTTAFVSRGNDGRTEITAYRLTDGRKLWSTLIDEIGPLAPEPIPGGVVLLRTDPVTVERQKPDTTRLALFFYRSTIALDATTGAQLWRAPGEQGALGDGRVLLGEHDERGDLFRLTMIGLRDGRRVWSRPVPGAESWTILRPGDRPAEVVTVDADNRVTFLRYDDGSVIRSAKLPGRVSTVSFLEGYLLATDARIESTSYQEDTTVYRWDDLSPQWTVETTDGGLIECAPLLCTADQTGVIAHDPATGRELWRMPGVRTARPAGDNRLLLYDFQDEGNTTLVDAMSGRPIGGTTPGQIPWASARHGSVLVLHHTRRPIGLVSVTRLDLATGTTTLLGAIDSVQEITCWDLEHYLACPQRGRLVVTDVG